MTLQDTGNFRRRLAAFLDPTNPNLDQIEPYPSVMGGEVKPPFFSTMPYLGGGSMEPIGPYIPSDDDSKVVPLSPLGGYLGGLMASHDKPFSKYPPAGGGTDGRYPGLSSDDIKRFVYSSKDLLNVPINPFGIQAKGGNPFSTDALDKQKQIRDYLNNDQKIRDLFRRQGKMKAEGMTFAGDLFSA